MCFFCAYFIFVEFWLQCHFYRTLDRFPKKECNLFQVVRSAFFFHLTNQTTKEFDNGVPDSSEEASYGIPHICKEVTTVF